jgi:cytoskeletal protein CcmA (bactofilin family)
MALWNQPAQGETAGKPQPEKVSAEPPAVAPVILVPPHKETAPRERRQSILGPGVTIEGKIEGNGDVLFGGKLKGDIQIKGDLKIEKGARVTAKINADVVIIGGEVEGNVTASSQVELLESAQLVGDLKASTLIVAAGSRMRGHVEFGWSDAESAKVTSIRVQETGKNSALS